MRRITLICLLAIASVAQLTYAQQVDRTANTDPYYTRKATLFDQLPITKHDIVMLGNSLTDGAEWHEMFGNNRVKNRGIVGDIIQGFIDRIDPILKGQPKKLFIMGGINDISHNVTPDSVARAMEKLVTLVQTYSPKTKIYIQSILPFNNDVRLWRTLVNKEQDVVLANELLKQVAQRKGCTFIDLYPKFVNYQGKLYPNFTNDGLHLTAAGYAVWYKAIKKYVK